MLTLVCEVLCDSCGKVCGVGEPHPSTEFAYVSSAIYEAERKARAHGAYVGISGVECRTCRGRKKPTKAEQEKALMRIMTADDFGQFE